MPPWEAAANPFEFQSIELEMLMNSPSPDTPTNPARELRYFQEQLRNARSQLERAREDADADHWRAMIRRYETVLALYKDGRLNPPN